MSIAQLQTSKNGYTGSLGKVLVAEADDNHRQWLISHVNDLGYEAIPVFDHGQLIWELTHVGNSTVILGVNAFDLDRSSGLAVYGSLLLEGLAAHVIFTAEERCSSTLDRATQMGARGFVMTSSNSKELKQLLLSSRSSGANRSCAGAILGESGAARELRDVIRGVAATDAAVMITGESGTGKELVAKAIHNCSNRVGENFVPVNMSALPESLVESVLFGHEKGAFTGADAYRPGLCQQSHRGTLFLDEIGEMNRDLQPKLLRFLQEYTVQPVGSATTQKVDSRIISATNRSVEDMVRTGILREDLFFRLHVIPIHVPALRERIDDIPLLATTFLDRNCRQMRKELSFSQAALDRLCEYTWPGNIRQLENMVERISVMAKRQVIGSECLPAEWFVADHKNSPSQSLDGCFVADLDRLIYVKDRQLTRMESAERQLIIEALRRHNGNVSSVAIFLGVGLATVYRKIRSLGIPKGSD